MLRCWFGFNRTFMELKFDEPEAGEDKKEQF